MYGNNDWRDYLAHHGIDGQKWGVRNGPPYPLDNFRKYKRAGIIPKNATAQNFESWGNSRNTNILYITGISGSGKSTVATNLKDEDTEVIHLDSYFDNANGPHCNDFDRYLESRGSEYKKMNLPKDKISLSDWGKVVIKFEKELEDYGKDAYARDKKIIVEGVQLLDDTLYPDKSYFDKKPLLVINTNAITSTIRGNRRDGIRNPLSNISEAFARKKEVRNVAKANNLRHSDDWRKEG